MSPSAVDLSALDPKTFADQLAHPKGAIGVAVGKQLNETNAGVHAAAYEAMALAPGDRILEIGFGNGHWIPDLIGRASGLRYFGIEVSETMLSEARAYNAASVAMRHVDLRLASSAQIPFPEASFDGVLALNTIYFWESPITDLREVRRVLRRGGRLVMGAIDPLSATLEFFRHGFRLYGEKDLRALLKAASFEHLECETLHEEVRRATGEIVPRDYFIMSAR